MFSDSSRIFRARGARASLRPNNGHRWMAGRMHERYNSGAARGSRPQAYLASARGGRATGRCQLAGVGAGTPPKGASENGYGYTAWGCQLLARQMVWVDAALAIPG